MVKNEYAYIGYENKQVLIGNQMGTFEVLQGGKQLITRKIIPVVQLKHSAKKNCKHFCAMVTQQGDKFKLDVNIKLVVQEFMDVFPGEINDLPPKRIVKHAINIIPRAKPLSKAP